MSDDKTGTTSEEAVKAPLVLGAQKPPRLVGKRFRVCFVAMPEKKKVKKPAGLKMRPLGCGRTAWVQA